MPTLGVDIGVTPQGFVAKTLTEIKDEVEADWRAEFGANVDLAPDSPDGQIIGIFCDRIAELWELAQSVYSAQDPDANGGQAQDAVCAITGTFRDAASYSTATVTATGTAGTLLTAGREVSVEGTEDRFATTADATLAAATAWASGAAVSVGDKRTNAVKMYVCTAGGTTHAAGAPVHTSSEATDANGVTWLFLGDGAAFADVDVEAVETGPISAVSGTLTVIETPVAGWSDVYNIEDAVPGEDQESDDELRVKREGELAAAGAGTPPAIRADILQVDGVTSCVVFKNDGPTDDADGRPPHSVEAVVEGGADEDIAAAIFANVSSGIRPYGTTEITVTDSQGLDWAVGFTRPSELDIWVRVDVVKDPLEFPVDGEDQIKAAIVGDEPNHPIGKNVVASRVSSRVFDVPGVLDVSLTYIGLANPPIASTTIDVDSRERANFDTSRITVNLSDGTP